MSHKPIHTVGPQLGIGMNWSRKSWWESNLIIMECEKSQINKKIVVLVVIENMKYFINSGFARITLMIEFLMIIEDLLYQKCSTISDY